MMEDVLHVQPGGEGVATMPATTSRPAVSTTTHVTPGLARVVVVDDEPDLREMLKEYLESQGFVVRAVPGGAELRRTLAEEPADLVLLDLRMPGEDGYSVARWLREHTDAAIIMVTSADETVDKVVGLEIGADDYVTKPFDLRELRARITSVLRRLPRPRGYVEPEAEPTRRVRMGRVWLDLDKHVLVTDDGGEQRLTAMEFDLLAAFADHPNRVLSRSQLLDLAHNRDWEPFDRSIDIRVARIRRKIEIDPAKPRVIKTVHGIGYVFVR